MKSTNVVPFYTVLIVTPDGPAEFKNIKVNYAKGYIDFIAEDGRHIVTSMPFFVQPHLRKIEGSNIVIPGASA